MNSSPLGGFSKLRVLVVGASSGIGREIAIQALRGGATVALAARRSELLESTVDCSAQMETGETNQDVLLHSRIFTTDVVDEQSCLQLVSDVSAWMESFGGLNTVVYAAGTTPLSSIVDTTTQDWHCVFATNVIGASSVFKAALPYLRHSQDCVGTIALLSSHSVGNPWPYLVPYAASKAALNELASGIRCEEPDIRVLKVVVGPTVTPFADAWDPDQAGSAINRWADSGFLHHQVLGADEAAGRILSALMDDSLDEVTIIGPDNP